VKDTCKLSGYKQQYLRQLLRQRKLSRRKIGQVWLTEVASLENYLFTSNQSQAEDVNLKQRKELVMAAEPPAYLIRKHP
jgi:hypothetical protein